MKLQLKFYDENDGILRHFTYKDVKKAAEWTRKLWKEITNYVDTEIGPNNLNHEKYHHLRCAYQQAKDYYSICKADQEEKAAKKEVAKSLQGRMCSFERMLGLQPPGAQAVESESRKGGPSTGLICGRPRDAASVADESAVNQAKWVHHRPGDFDEMNMSLLWLDETSQKLAGAIDTELATMQYKKKHWQLLTLQQLLEHEDRPEKHQKIQQAIKELEDFFVEDALKQAPWYYCMCTIY